METPNYHKRAKYVLGELKAIDIKITDRLIPYRIMPNDDTIPDSIDIERVALRFLVGCRSISRIDRPEIFTNPSITTEHGLNLLEEIWENTNTFITTNYGEKYEGLICPFPQSIAIPLLPSMQPLIKLVWDLRESCSSCIDYVEFGSVENHK